MEAMNLSKQKIIKKVVVVILSVLLCFGLAGVAILSGFTPMSMLVIKDMLVANAQNNDIVYIADNEIPLSNGTGMISGDSTPNREGFEQVLDTCFLSIGRSISEGNLNIDNLFSQNFLLIYAILLFMTIFLVVILGWREKDWLINIGVAGMIASVIIVSMPILLVFVEDLLLQNRYEIANKEYYIKIAAIIGCISIAMIGIKTKILNIIVTYEVTE